MSAKVIPKERLTAYQRWELGGLEHAEGPEAQPAAPAAGAEESVAAMLPTAEELERLQQQAWQEGFREGREEGRRAGLAAGLQEGRGHVERLKRLIEEADAAVLRQDDQVAREVLELALAVARQMLRTTLKVDRRAILGVVREAINTLPSLTGHTRLVVHPAFAATLREWLGQEHPHLSWKVVEDGELEPGGFRVENAHSELDASMPVRWREIVANLGVDSAWLESSETPP